MHEDDELITIAVPSSTTRRLATIGFPHDLELKDVARFLIEQGLTILEKRDRPRAA
jgi:hypothetical protein